MSDQLKTVSMVSALFGIMSNDKDPKERESKVKYQKKNSTDKESHYEMLRKLELSKKDHIILKKYCDFKGLEFISTPYDIESAKFLISLKLKTINL